MPELPEVETIRNELSPHVTGHVIKGIELFWERAVSYPSAAEFKQKIAGQKILKLGRRGKYLIFQLASGQSLIVHLRMTGSLLVKPANEAPDKYVRSIIRLDNGQALQMRDPRKMGRLWLVDDITRVVGALGPEPLEPGFTLDVFEALLKRHGAPVKAVLIDQNIIAGVGNMYADEALYRARVHPLRLADQLSHAEMEKLFTAIREILLAAIENKGASVENYYRPDGKLGTAHYHFQVAHRLGGKECPVCGGPVERIEVRNRGTYFCPKCQKLPKTGKSTEARA